jgi:ribosomal protein L2
MSQLKKSKPITPGVRHKVKRVGVISGDQSVPKGLVKGMRKSGGRNHQGRITCWHHGGGNKVRGRRVTSMKPLEVGKIRGIQFDPTRWSPIALVECVSLVGESQMGSQVLQGSIVSGSISNGQGLRVGGLGSIKLSGDVLSNAFIGLGDVLSDDLGNGVVHKDSSFKGMVDLIRESSFTKEGVNKDGSNCYSYLRYITAGEGMKVGDILACCVSGMELSGNYRTQRMDVPIGTSVYDIRPLSDSSMHLVCAPGCSAVVLRQDVGFTRLRMPSGEERRFNSSGLCSLGLVGCKDHQLEVVGKAGITRARGIRPTVRGCAMNPVDHPHGGRTKGGRHDVTPWAKIAKGQPTRDKKKGLGLIVKTVRQVNRLLMSK